MFARTACCLALASACYQPVSPASCTVSCVDGTSCPSGLVCGGDHACRRDHEPDCVVTTPWLDGFTRRRLITLEPPPLVEPLADFPVAITLATDAQLAMAAAEAGPGVAFTSADGTTLLPSEIEKFDAAAGDLAAWVRIGSFAGRTQIYFYYGGPPFSSGGAWGPAFQGVWHLSGMDPASARDSTPFAHHLSQVLVASQPVIVAGIIGDARRFDGNADLDTGGTVFAPGLASFSYSLWVMTTERPASGFEGPFYNGAQSSNDPGFDVERTHDDWRANFADGVQVTEAGAEFSTSGTELLGRWVQLAAVADRSAQMLSAYVDGELRNTADISSFVAPNHSGHLTLGSIDGSQFYIGVIDEVRVYSQALSASWIATEHANLASPDQFVTTGPEAVRP